MLFALLLFSGRVAVAGNGEYTGLGNDQPPANAKRFLFIFDTSLGMRSHLSNTFTALNQVFAAGTNGLFAKGDTIGVWTFNKDVHSTFPLQTWSRAEDANAKILPAIKTFLQKQKFTNDSHLETVLPNLAALVKDSDTLTTIILYSGAGKFTGSQFDAEINKFLTEFRKKATSKELPVAIVLQSIEGNLTQYTANAYPWPVEIPELPKPATPPAVFNTPAKTNSAPKKPVVVEAPKPAPVVTPTPTPAPAPAPILATSTAPALTQLAQPTVVVEAPKPQPIATPAPAPVITQPIAPPAVVVPPVAETKPVEKPVVVTPPPAPKPVVIEPPVVKEPPKPVAPPAVVAVEKKPVEEKPAPIAEPKPIAAAQPGPAPAPVVEPKVVIATEAPAFSKFFLVTGIVLVIIAVILIVMIWLRSRSDSDSSYITKSMGDKRR